MGNKEWLKYNIFVDGKLEVSTDDIGEVGPYLKLVHELSTWAVRDKDGVVYQDEADFMVFDK
jgi:hypothetical protein